MALLLLVIEPLLPLLVVVALPRAVAHQVADLAAVAAAAVIRERAVDEEVRVPEVVL